MMRVKDWLTGRMHTLWSRRMVRDVLALQIGKLIVAGIGVLSALVVFRVLGPAALGTYGLAQSFLALLTSLDLTGLGASTATRLGVALGGEDTDAIRDLLAYHVKISVALNIGFVILLVTAGPPLAALIQGDARIGVLAAGLAVAGLADGLYTLVMIALQARRSMRAAATLQVVNQGVLSAALIAAALIAPTAESLVIGRMIYSFGTMGIALIAYRRLRRVQSQPYPPMTDVFRRALHVPVRPYWRFGVANAVDRSLSNLFLQVPIQLVGVFGGARAVGYLDLALSGIEQARILLLAITENIAAVIPQAVGRKDYRTLWRHFTRSIPAFALVALIYYGLVALLAGLVIGIVVGEQWLPATPAVFALVLFGGITTLGSLFGPLYRALDLLALAIFVKVCAVLVGLPLAAILIAAGDQSATVATQGGWAISAVYALSVGLTVVFSLRSLHRRAQMPAAAQSQ